MSRLSILLALLFLGGGTVSFVRPSTLCLNSCGEQSLALSDKSSNNSQNIWTIGDSLTASTYPTQLAVLSQRQVVNWGVIGQTSDEVAARLGALPSAFEVTSGLIPEVGPVDVKLTPATADFLRTGQNLKILGTLGGIYGTLSRTGTFDTRAGQYSFERAKTGLSMKITAGASFVPDTENLTKRIMVIWIGRNNYGNIEGVKRDIASIVAKQKGSRKFVVLSVLNGDYPNERLNDKDHHIYTTIIELNNDLREIYPENFIDIRKELSQNTTDDVTPAKIRKDELHLNNAGDSIVAKRVFNFIKSKNW